MGNRRRDAGGLQSRDAAAGPFWSPPARDWSLDLNFSGFGLDLGRSPAARNLKSALALKLAARFQVRPLQRDAGPGDSMP